jgi:serine phosphatase RsbU (regulator of sigma subunit)
MAIGTKSKFLFSFLKPTVMNLLAETDTSTQFLEQIRELETRLETLETQRIEMEQSIRYAGRLQFAVLPMLQSFKECFSDAFVLFQPRDIVSGDFYWIYQFGDDIYFAVGDCTGHGVPGAMVNMAGSTLLRQIIRQEGVSDPGLIMYILNEELVNLFNENLSSGKTNDGMDIVFCKFNKRTMTGSYCGAGRPLLMVRDGELIEFKKGPSAIGYFQGEQKVFETETFDLAPGDSFYLFSDGYTDQFGGENVKKFNRKRLRNILLSVNEFSMEKQKEELLFQFNNWKGKQVQIDDVCIIGVRI